ANWVAPSLKGLTVVAKVDGLELRSEEHTSELQSLAYLVCRLLLEKKDKRTKAVLLFCLVAFAALREILGISVLLSLGLSFFLNDTAPPERCRFFLHRFKLF